MLTEKVLKLSFSFDKPEAPPKPDLAPGSQPQEAGDHTDPTPKSLRGLQDRHPISIPSPNRHPADRTASGRLYYPYVPIPERFFLRKKRSVSTSCTHNR